jgi:glycosyltransferase involved in cell wall biosynthesis
VTSRGPITAVAPQTVHHEQPFRFSVVIPAYNEEELIGDCLASLARQDFQGPFEVIVVDNNSTDRTSEIARASGATVVREETRGVCWARQRGTTVASGEIVISTDADSTFGPGWLSRIDRIFRDDTARVAVAGPCRFVDAPLWGRLYAWLLFTLVHLISRVSGRIPYVSATNIAFRRSAWAGYDTHATQGGDEVGLMRQLRSRGPIYFDLGNPTFTSSRRLYRGLVYNIFVTCIFYYIIGYWLNRLAGRTLVGMAPSFRGEAMRRQPRWGMARVVITSLCLLLFLVIGRLAVA